MSKLKVILIGYLISVVALFFYSFTQVDLGLTLTEWSIWQVLQTSFQRIGYFNRPLSAYLFVAVILSLFIFYLLIIRSTINKKITLKQIWFLFILTTIILVFSYNAFSYDLFNYIFDAKIVTFYHQNPYLHKALDYPLDPMLGFMHWTHRTYPYGPSWLLLTIPVSFIGFQHFLITAVLFKIIAGSFFIGTIYYLWKLAKKTIPNNSLFPIVIFGLNPLVVIESLISAHNDIAMIFFVISSFYFLSVKKYWLAILLIFLSIGIKFATALLIPIFVLIVIYQIKKKIIPWTKIYFLSILLMVGAVIFASFRTNFQPWYLLFILPFAAMLGNKYYILIPSIIVSFFAPLRYLPFLYLGNWDPPVPTILNNLLIISIILSIFIVGVWYFKTNYIKAK